MDYTTQQKRREGSQEKNKKSIGSTTQPTLQQQQQQQNAVVLIGFTIRIFLAWLLPYLLDDEEFIPGVAYTDIDYHVFTDAVYYVRDGLTPYERDTYRYTPFLAAFLAILPHPRVSSRYLFCLADTICGYMILQFRQKQRQQEGDEQEQLTPSSSSSSSSSWWKEETFQDALWWLYNPFAINICTRGSAESLIALLPVLMTLWLLVTNFQQQQQQQQQQGEDPSSSSSSSRPSSSLLLSATVAGLWHGIAIHAKLYPIIYSLSYVCYLATRTATPTLTTSNQRQQMHCGGGSLMSWMKLWAERLLTPIPIAFAFSSAVTFAVLTYLSVVLYGPLALEEGLLYHFSRVDHRHNYSMHFYWIYLSRASGQINMKLVGLLLTIPQLVLLVYTSFTIAPTNLSLALFVQTFTFVAFNKVITAQYFTWYLCLLPLCSNCFNLTRRVGLALVCLLVSMLFWLGSAFCLEMQGMAVHRIVWVASVVFFAANVNLLTALLGSSRHCGREPRGKQSNDKKKD